jgi:hypothetical protein
VVAAVYLAIHLRRRRQEHALASARSGGNDA